MNDNDPDYVVVGETPEYAYARIVRAIRHVITPTAGLNYLPDNSTQIEGPFGLNGAIGNYSPFDIGIYGKPTSSESATVNLGLIQSLEAKVRDRQAMQDSAGISDEIQ